MRMNERKIERKKEIWIVVKKAGKKKKREKEKKKEKIKGGKGR